VRAAIWSRARDVRLVERDIPTPGSAEVVIEVAYCGICGSDVHEYVDGPHAIPVGSPHPESGAVAPIVLGHEFCGTVVAVGARATRVRVGDRVAVEPNYRCGRCRRCLAGEYNICQHFGFAGLMGDGGAAEFTAIPEYMVHRLPESVSLEQAAVFEPAAVALHSFRRGGVTPTDKIVVIGLGPIGLLIVMLAAQAGVRRIAAVDVAPHKLDLAGELGATDVIDAGSGMDVAQQVRDSTGGEGADVTFEAVGSERTLRTGLNSTRKGGRVVLIGLAGTVSIDAFALVNNEQSIIASVGYRDVYPELIRLVAEGGLDLTRIVTSIIGLDDVVSQGFEALLSGKEEIKILARPQAPQKNGSGPGATGRD
jgi:(R,R)-butanediol dehydrogenase / meso-butanediol dehydrogenase / diacetyl reductase